MHIKKSLQTPLNAANLKKEKETRQNNDSRQMDHNQIAEYFHIQKNEDHSQVVCCCPCCREGDRLTGVCEINWRVIIKSIQVLFDSEQTVISI